MVYHHVEGVIYEVSDGEADEGVAGGGEGGDQVILHPRGLLVQPYFQIWEKCDGRSRVFKINLECYVHTFETSLLYSTKVQDHDVTPNHNVAVWSYKECNSYLWTRAGKR